VIVVIVVRVRVVRVGRGVVVGAHAGRLSRGSGAESSPRRWEGRKLAAAGLRGLSGRAAPLRPMG
jgi:hypothetical protein